MKLKLLKLREFIGIMLRGLINIAFALSVIFAWICEWNDEGALAAKMSISALILFLAIVYIEVIRLKEWGEKNLHDLITAADKVSEASEKGMKVKINGKDFSSQHQH